MTAKFGMSSFGSRGAMPRSLGKPAAIYPGAVVTDAQLKLAVDRLQTTLAAPLDTIATTMTVADASRLAANVLASIDNELVSVTGAPSGNVVPISRGFDGTTPSIHLSGAIVSGSVDAWHHNALVAEIEAIENALGANLSKVPTSPFLVNTMYAFPAQSPGGSLIAGNNSITLSPVPAGINGTDTGHYLYISGGTGAPEAALITGGNAVGGAPSGTLIIQCANAHSGAWTISSATSGIAEALSALLPSGGQVWVAAGEFPMYGTLTIPRDGITIEGAGPASRLTWSNAANDCISVSGRAQCTIRDLTIKGVGKTGGWGINTLNTNNLTLKNLWIDSVQGINLVSNIIALIDSVVFLNLRTNMTGIHIYGGNDQMISNLVMDWDGSNYYDAGIHIEASGGAMISHADVIHAASGLLIDPPAGATVTAIQVSNVWFDSCGSNGIVITPVSTGVNGTDGITDLRLTDCWACSSGGNGVVIGGSGTYASVSFKGLVAFNNANHGVVIGGQGKNTDISNSTICANSQANPNQFDNIMIAAGASNWRIQNNTIGGNLWGNIEKASFAIGISDGASDYFTVLGNRITAGLAGAIYDGATGAHACIEGNIGWNPVGISTIAVGASPFTYKAGHQPEVVYITGGTVSSINRGGAVAAFTSSPASIPLPPGGTVTVAYSALPTMNKDVL